MDWDRQDNDRMDWDGQDNDRMDWDRQDNDRIELIWIKILAQRRQEFK